MASPESGDSHNWWTVLGVIATPVSLILGAIGGWYYKHRQQTVDLTSKEREQTVTALLGFVQILQVQYTQANQTIESMRAKHDEDMQKLRLKNDEDLRRRDEKHEKDMQEFRNKYDQMYERVTRENAALTGELRGLMLRQNVMQIENEKRSREREDAILAIKTDEVTHESPGGRG